MTEIRNKLDDIFIRLPATPINQGSPIRLTDLGERISNDINAEEWAEALASEMFEDTKGLDAFKIQEKSFEKAKNFKPDESLPKKMQSSAFKEGLKLYGIRDVLGVELRDCLLARHEIKIESLD